ncbi:GLPGLI family protein [Nonlabens antarcticus]|uniref:GLPGLI family protein n=1 Tax=Nonlabens antarcticus TaxID=392714 RepID=UPI001890DC44|nr:GLPGLI family protein [Nonlabens antarcticus]
MKDFKWMAVAVVYIAFAKANTLQAQQEFKAIANYISQTKVDIKPDTTKAKNPQQAEWRAKMMESLSKGQKNEFTLEFTGKESYYEEVKQLAKPTTNGGFSMTFSGMGNASNTIYKDLQKQQFFKEDEILGKEFLIVDQLPQYNWQLSQETKMIGNYLCYKATYLPELTESQKEAKAKKEEEKEAGGLLAQIEDKDRTITAWYAPEIPVSNGPGEYQGLPGLILEVKESETIILCTKIEINPENDLNIKKPRSGKEINQKDFDALSKKKYKERMERSGGSGVIVTEIIRN